MKKEQLSILTVVELKAMAKENGLKGYSKLRKAELVELLAIEVDEAKEEYYVHGEKAVNTMKKEVSEKEMDLLNPEIIFTKIENGTYKVLKTDNDEWQLLDENKKILEDVYIYDSNSYTDYEISVGGLHYDKEDIERNNTINRKTGLNLSHEILSMLYELAYHKCANEGFHVYGSFSYRIEKTVQSFAQNYENKENLVLSNDLSVCLHTMTIHENDKIKEMEFWHPLIEELGIS